MPRLTNAGKDVLYCAALAALVGLAWRKARREAPAPASDTAPHEPAAFEPPVPDTMRARRRGLPAGRLAAVVAVVALIVSGMAFSAAPSERLEATRPAAQPFQPSPASRMLLLPVASRHFYDVAAAPRPAAPAPRTTPDERTASLARLVDAVGGDAMLAGLEAERLALAQRVLADPRIHVYPGGRNDLASGKIDPRIDAVLEYLADAYDEVTVSCLIAGHSYYVHQTKRQKKLKLPKVVSAHVSGRAVDISAVAGVPIAGNQQPGGITERTIRTLLALPDWLRPKQVISLLELGGPSFALPDHADHIHVGY